jgi:hypothetical protein
LGCAAQAEAPAAAPASAACSARGSRTVNSVNSPGRLSTVIVPPCCDLCQVGVQGFDQFVLLGVGSGDRVLQLTQQLMRELGKIVHEVERVLDLVGDAGRQLAQRRHLLGMDQIRLGQPLPAGVTTGICRGARGALCHIPPRHAPYWKPLNATFHTV